MSVNVFIDAVGLPLAIEEGFDALKSNGRLVVVGIAPASSEIRLSFFHIYLKKANIRDVNWSLYSSLHRTISP